MKFCPQQQRLAAATTCRCTQCIACSITLNKFMPARGQAKCCTSGSGAGCRRGVQLCSCHCCCCRHTAWLCHASGVQGRITPLKYVVVAGSSRNGCWQMPSPAPSAAYRCASMDRRWYCRFVHPWTKDGAAGAQGYSCSAHSDLETSTQVSEVQRSDLLLGQIGLPVDALFGLEIVGVLHHAVEGHAQQAAALHAGSHKISAHVLVCFMLYASCLQSAEEGR